MQHVDPNLILEGGPPENTALAFHVELLINFSAPLRGQLHVELFLLSVVLPMRLLSPVFLTPAP